MQHIDLRITIDEANLILEALGNMPFKQVYSLIGKIQQEASQQLNAMDQAAEPPTEIANPSGTVPEQ